MDPGKKTDKFPKDSLKNWKLDPPSKPLKTDLPSKPRKTNTSGSREGSPSDATSCISSRDATTYSIEESEVDQASMADQGMYYYGYYPGFSGSFGAWDEQSYSGFADHGSDHVEIQPSVIQSDDGSVLYYLPGYHAGYVPYNPVLPGAMISVDGQYLGQPSYYPNAVFQQPLTSPGFSPQSVPYGAELVPAYPWDSSLPFANGFQGNGYGEDLTNTTTKSNFSSRSYTLASSKSSMSSKSATSDSKGSSLVLDVAPSPKQPFKPVNKGSLPVFSKAYLPTNNVSSYTNQGKGGPLHPNSHNNVKEYGKNWVGGEKVKNRNKLQGFGDFDLQIKQYHGPRTNSTKSSLNSAVDLVGSVDFGKNDNASTPIATVKKDIYNLPDFSTKYDQALFFVIKSYSEDDIHKSIKYNVWASTPNGNKRLDNAFQIAQDKMAENGSSCPVFLFFSVNASGQFCGVAEMLDRVDFTKNMDFWQQDKWNGFFPVKWHIIKDIPNPQFRHIILENNENKPVTNSRDTQEMASTKPLTTESIALTEKKMDMSLDDIIKMSKKPTTKDKRVPRPPIKNQGFLNGSASRRNTVAQRFMDSRSFIRQGMLAQRTDFRGNQFQLATNVARNAAAMPVRGMMVNRNKPRVAPPPVQRKFADGGSFGKEKMVVPKPRPQTLDALFANMKEQRMRVFSAHQHNTRPDSHQMSQRRRARQQQQQQQQRGGARSGRGYYNSAK